MTLVVVHYHLRPGGIRRIIELSVPFLVRSSPQRIVRVVLATGEAPDPAWERHLQKLLPSAELQIAVEPAFRYISEQRITAAETKQRIQRTIAELLGAADPGSIIVWAHNLGVARNLILASELGDYCERLNIPLLAHHHDWWFDNRWMRWPEMRASGFGTLSSTARTVFPVSPSIRHAAINQADAAILRRHFGPGATWMPNLSPESLPISRAAAQKARKWIEEKLGEKGAPVWLLPCRTLRRKNIAEALLLTRWLRPEAFLVVTGGPSSADEAPYAQALEHAARRHGWRFCLGALAGQENGQPGVPELLASSETVLLTSIQEGFGLPYLEAAAAGRPLIARRLPNIAPDLRRFGFRFPQSYEEILIPPELFDWHAERQRQSELLRAWLGTLPSSIKKTALRPALLVNPSPATVPFSRLTLRAQLQVLARPAESTWDVCVALNPFLRKWRQALSGSGLTATAWPKSASRWLSGEAYAERFFRAIEEAIPPKTKAGTSGMVQRDFIAAKLDPSNLYPLLWTKQP